MISFESDYNTGAHEEILKRLIETNYEQVSGYGNDKYCASAKEKIKQACASPESDVHFLVGGTQTNKIIISTMLKNFECVIAADTGHINGHEAGAIENGGHKVICLPHINGKIQCNDLEQYLDVFYKDENHDHMIQPGMVYVSHPTEYGTLYTKEELTAIFECCKKYGLKFFLDGARLGYGLMSDGTDLTLNDIATICDVFYIGGTKVGALCGEAVVFKKGATPEHFFTSIKQYGALLAKGRLLGIQFDTLFTDDLYFKISKNAIEHANRLREILKNKGYSFFIPTTTNQIFVSINNQKLKELRKNVAVGFWEKLDDDNTVIRFATSWSTSKNDIDTVEKYL